MSSVIQNYSSSETHYLSQGLLEEQPCWYAIHTRARHEKKIEVRLKGCGISTFLPVVTQVHRWSDRRKVVEFPLFCCYLFINIVLSNKARLTVLRTGGVIGFVGGHGRGTPIPDVEVESLRTLLSHHVAITSHPFLKIGQRVRIRGGSLDGVEGLIANGSNERKLVLSIKLIQRSIAVTIDGYDIQVL